MEGFDERRSRRVLVVDDDADSLSVLALLLEHDGHEVRSSSSGLAALDEATGFRPEVVILDLRLRDMSGYQLASALRAREGAEATVLVALTGLEGADVRDRCRAAGFDCHLVKPIRDFTRFRELVRSMDVHRDIRLV